MSEVAASEQIDDIIKRYDGWKGDVLKHLRAIVKDADSSIIEEIKWKMPTRPEGLPVWTHDGIVCFAETWNDNIKLIFFKGAQLTDPNKLFNARLKSSTVRAVELHEGDQVDEAGIKALIAQAVELNANKVNRP